MHTRLSCFKPQPPFQVAATWKPRHLETLSKSCFKPQPPFQVAATTIPVRLAWGFIHVSNLNLLFRWLQLQYDTAPFLPTLVFQSSTYFSSSCYTWL